MVRKEIYFGFACVLTVGERGANWTTAMASNAAMNASDLGGGTKENVKLPLVKTKHWKKSVLK